VTLSSEDILDLLNKGVLPELIPTKTVVAILNHRNYHRKKLYTYELRDRLEGRRVGAGKLFYFSTLRVLELRNKLKNQPQDETEF